MEPEYNPRDGEARAHSCLRLRSLEADSEMELLVQLVYESTHSVETHKGGTLAE